MPEDRFFLKRNTKKSKYFFNCPLLHARDKGVVKIPMFSISVNPNNWFVNVNDLTNDDVPSKVTGKIGDDLKIECKIPNFELKFFAWKFCASECRSPTAVWKMVVKVDYGETEILNRTKFDMAPDGSLILKDIQPHNDRNWVRCFHKKQFVGLDHRSTIIFVAQGNYTELIDGGKYMYDISLENSVKKMRVLIV